VDWVFLGRAPARRGDGLGAGSNPVGTAANPATHASGGSPTHRGCDDLRRCHSRRCSWVDQKLDAAMAWGQRRTQQPRRRAESRPTGGVLTSPGSRSDGARGSSNSSTRRRHGYSGESSNPGVGVKPDRRGPACRLVGHESLHHALASDAMKATNAAKSASIPRVPSASRGPTSHPPTAAALPCVGRPSGRRGDVIETAANPGARVSVHRSGACTSAAKRSVRQAPAELPSGRKVTNARPECAA